MLLNIWTRMLIYTENLRSTLQGFEIFAMHLLQRAKNVPYPVQHIPFYRKRLVIAIILHNKIFSSLVYTLCLRGLQYLAGSTHRKVSLSGVVYFFLAKGQITQLVSKLISTTTSYISYFL